MSSQTHQMQLKEPSCFAICIISNKRIVRRNFPGKTLTMKNELRGGGFCFNGEYLANEATFKIR